MRRSGTLFGLLICGLIVVLTAQMCGKPQQRAHSTAEADVYLNHADTVDYVGKETCLKCHTDKHTFLHTGMGLSFDHASPEKSAADFKPLPHVYDSFNDLHYTAYWRDEELWMKEYRLENGDTIHQLNQKIDFIVGSGQHTNSHLFKVHDLVFQAPMTWYAQKGKWDLPPGFENGNNSRFSRWIDLECMSCHNAMPVMKKESGREFLQIGQGIDCERCHGPGELHVQLKMKGRSATDEQGIDRSIVNPAKLSWDRQIDLCQRCHLQGLNQLKEGKTFTDYKPGMVLKDVFEIYLPRFEGGTGRFDMANHAQRLQMSACFIKSGSGEGESPLTCISCHNPHVSVKVSGKAVFNQQCVQCHQDKGCSADESILLANDNNCIQCHMPPTNAEDIPHVTVHDHYIRKPLQAREKEQIGLLTGLYSVNNPKPETVDLLRAYLSYFEKFDKNPFYLEKAKELLSAGGIKEQVHYAYLKGNTAELIRLSEPYLEEEHKDAWTAYRIGEAFLQQKLYREAAYWLEKASSARRESFEFATKLGIAQLKNGRLQQAEKAFRMALDINPNYALALSNLSSLLFQKQRATEGLELLKRCLSLHPDYIPALEQMAGWHLINQNESAAITLANRILKIDPQNRNAIRIKQSMTNVR